MHVLWLIPNYYSFLVEEIQAMAPLVDRLTVVSQSPAQEIKGVRCIEIPKSRRSIAGVVDRVLSAVRLLAYMPVPREVKHLEAFQRVARAGEFLSRYIETEDVDVVHCHFAYPEGTAAFPYLRNKPLVVTLRGVDILTCESIGYGFCLDSFYRKTVGKTICAASRTTVASITSAQAVGELCGEAVDTRVIPNGVDLSSYSREVSGQAVIEKFGLTGKKLILAVGNLVAGKGFNYLIEAMGVIRAFHCEAKLLILGDGVERQELQRQIDDAGLTDHVILVGRVERGEIPSFFAACDVFVHPSLTEGFGNVILEAMAMGCPVAVTNTGVAADLVDDGVNGLVISKENPQSIADAVTELLGDEGKAKGMGAKAASAVEGGSFSMNSRAKAFVDIYSEIVTGKPNHVT